MSKEHLAHIIGHNADLIILIWLGASARAGSNYLSAKKRRLSYRVLDYVITLTIGGFMAALFGLGSAWAEQPEIAQYLSAGLGAYLGIEGLNRVTTTFIKGR